jgi:hypothetical protein
MRKGQLGGGMGMGAMMGDAGDVGFGAEADVRMPTAMMREHGIPSQPGMFTGMQRNDLSGCVSLGSLSAPLVSFSSFASSSFSVGGVSMCTTHSMSNI